MTPSGGVDVVVLDILAESCDSHELIALCAFHGPLGRKVCPAKLPILTSVSASCEYTSLAPLRKIQRRPS